MTKIVEIYTDGSCNYKSKDGGIGIYMKYNGHEKEYHQGFHGTTNNRMELLAATKALEMIPSNYKVVLYSDSQYVVNAIQKQWLFVWERHNFLGTKNSDLWKRFLKAYRKFEKGTVKLKWVKGHQKNINEFAVGNNKADELAGKGYKEASGGLGLEDDTKAFWNFN